MSVSGQHLSGAILLHHNTVEGIRRSKPSVLSQVCLLYSQATMGWVCGTCLGRQRQRLSVSLRPSCCTLLVQGQSGLHRSPKRKAVTISFNPNLLPEDPPLNTDLIIVRVGSKFSATGHLEHRPEPRQSMISASSTNCI